MNSVVIPATEWIDILTAVTAGGGPWDGALLHLFKNDYVPNQQTLIGDLTSADFTGYAASGAVVWDTPGFLPDGTAVVEGDAKTFRVDPAPTVLNTVFGWYLTDGAGTTLLLARRFDNPIVLSAAGQVLTVLPAYPAYLSV